MGLLNLTEASTTATVDAYFSVGSTKLIVMTVPSPRAKTPSPTSPARRAGV